MKNLKGTEIWAKWFNEKKLLHIRFGGLLNQSDFEKLSGEIKECLPKIDDGSEIKLFADLYEFKAENFEVHKKFRLVIPEIMIEHGMLPGYSKLFPEAEVIINPNPRFKIIKVAHCHNDEEKINRYHKEFSSFNEDFFISQKSAYEWLKNN